MQPSALLRAALPALAAGSLHAAPLPVIFDTDMGNDVDDVLALAMLHALEARGACRLLAVTVTKDHPLAAPLVDVLNTRCGHPGLTIGTVRDGATRDEGRFLGLVNDRDPQGALLHPHDLADGTRAPDAVRVLRQTLAAADDHSVAIVQVGFSTNLARLLDSPADDAAPLAGRDLVQQKVALLSIMAGAFAPIHGNPRYREYNVTNDLPAARKLADQWPTPVVWSGFEIGIAATFPHQCIERDFAPDDPVREAYRRYEPPPHDRPTWDLTAALHAVWPDRGYFELSPPGRVSIDAEGVTTFRPEDGGRDRYLILPAAAVPRLREAMVMLCSQPVR